MEKIYKTEKEGQIAFFDNYNVPWQERFGGIYHMMFQMITLLSH